MPPPNVPEGCNTTALYKNDATGANEELDNFMREVDASGDDQIDFTEFKDYWEKNLDGGG